MFVRRHGWTLAVLSSLPALVVAGLVWACVSDGPLLLARLSGGERQAFYGALSSTAGALLGLMITALAILIALPSSETVKAIRKYAGWRTLFELLLVAIVLLGVLLALSLVALVADVGIRPREKLSMAVVGSAGAAGVGITAVTLFFSLVVAALIKDWR